MHGYWRPLDCRKVLFSETGFIPRLVKTHFQRNIQTWSCSDSETNCWTCEHHTDWNGSVLSNAIATYVLREWHLYRKGNVQTKIEGPEHLWNLWFSFITYLIGCSITRKTRLHVSWLFVNVPRRFPFPLRYIISRCWGKWARPPLDSSDDVRGPNPRARQSN